jgi:hypothetical protein
MKYKDDVIAARFKDMNLFAQRIATEMDEWSKKNHGIELTLTATCSDNTEDKILGRISDTHRTRRAWDIRVRDLPESLVAELCAYFRKKYNKYGAVAENAPQLIVYKPHGTGPHLHCQLNRNYALSEIKYGKT